MAKVRLRDLAAMEDKFVFGHGLCPGCGVPIMLKMVLRASDYPLVVANATGCLEVCSSGFPYTAWKTPWVHNAFENAAATAAGLEAAYKALKKRGRLPGGDKKIKIIAFGGDGGTYDIGLQALSGAMERGHDIVYICYDNQSYANTGGQRSGATPYGASATTSPAGKKIKGKLQWRKNLTEIMAAHDIYAAQASVSHWKDLYSKAKKAIEIDGPAFINVLIPCPTEWKTKTEDGVRLAKLAVDTKVWPLYEVEGGKHKINYYPKKEIPVEEWLKPQGRFAHMFREENSWMIEEYQKKVNEDWERLVKLTKL